MLHLGMEIVPVDGVLENEATVLTTQSAQVAHVPGASLSALAFKRFWIDYHQGLITVGAGPPGSGDCYSWRDPAPSPGVQCVGLSAWDSHVAYRNIHVRRLVMWVARGFQGSSVHRSRQLWSHT